MSLSLHKIFKCRDSFKISEKNNDEVSQWEASFISDLKGILYFVFHKVAWLVVGQHFFLEIVEMGLNLNISALAW